MSFFDDNIVIWVTVICSEGSIISKTKGASNNFPTSKPCGPCSVVGIATRYGLDGPGIESRWGEIFRTSPDRS